MRRDRAQSMGRGAYDKGLVLKTRRGCKQCTMPMPVWRAGLFITEVGAWPQEHTKEGTEGSYTAERARTAGRIEHKKGECWPTRPMSMYSI